ncbi:MAG: hypothetical protein CM15mP74_11230 [Halieaceae bacterium]|nr:MAG: hypothetical protein CM15mP74_11230 [Halieaceae bacterium]
MLRLNWGCLLSKTRPCNVLLSGVDIGEEVPESLYRAVAVVLAWVFWLRGDEPGRG